MRILFDHGTPAPLIPFLTGHSVMKAKYEVWDRLENGELLKAAEEAGFNVLIATDKNMVMQQNLKAAPLPFLCLAIPMAHRTTPRPQDCLRRERRRTGGLAQVEVPYA